MPTRRVLLSLTITLLAILPAAGRATGEVKPPPNIVLLVLDTLRADHLGCYGSDRGLSPFIDRLAGEGVVFERVISQSSWTKTSMASMFTACNPASHNLLVRADRMAGSATLLAERLKARGYHCLGVQTNPWLTEEYGFHQGFDDYHYLDPADAGVQPEPAYIAADTVVRVAAGHAARNSHRPLFLYIHFMDPHAPYDPPAAFRPNNPQSEQLLYEGEIRFLDDQLRKLYRGLGEIGLRRNTLLVLVSDHGEEFGEHGGTGHGQTLYHEVLHVPLILHGDALKPLMESGGATVPQVARLIDLAPTLIEVAGAEPLPPGAEGRSMLPLIGSGRLLDRAAFSQLGLNFNPKKQDDYFDSYALTTREGKMIIDIASGSEEYYRTATDPDERTNLTAWPSSTARKMKRRLESYIGSAARERSPIEKNDSEKEQTNRDQLRALGYVTDDE